ncbi:MAG: hypothetical protein HUU06_13165 [Planctomycetaceae bacterium]|nr:hypothetical protein [Planctomycetota bacterium]NUN53716.1 hypothetical protein [Planctomycetaceae bacterium]
MGKKKWCFGREDFVCLTKDCPYMADCIKVVWDKKVSRMLTRMRPRQVAPLSLPPDDATHPVPAATPARRSRGK